MKINKLEYYDILKYKWLSYYDEAVKLRQGKKIIPRLATFHTNYICNYFCSDCKCKNINENNNLNIKYSDALKIVKDLIKIGVKSIDFSGGGEPLLTPELPRLFEFINKKNVAIGIITNGFYLKNEILKSCIDNAEYIRIGLDACNKKMYSEMKNISENCFDIVSENIANAIDYRNKNGNKCEITVKYTLNSKNCDELEKMIKYALKLNVDAVFVKAYENSEYPMKNIEKIQSDINRLKKKYSDKISIIGSVMPEKNITYCWLNPMQITVDMFGDVYLCSYYESRKKSHCIGNMFKDKLNKIWFSEKHLNCMKNIDMKICSQYSCKLHKANYYMKQLLEESNKLSFV